MGVARARDPANAVPGTRRLEWWTPSPAKQGAGYARSKAERRGRVLVTGGAGFVGAHLVLTLRSRGLADHVVALDNLSRRGSELALPRLRAGEVEFVFGDVRNPEDLDRVGPVDLLVECSAEPSVQAGYASDPRFLLKTNLVGTLNCLEYLRSYGGDLLFLSTSRVHSIAALRSLPLERRGARFSLPEGRSGPGWSPRGIALGFATQGYRSLYGATKLCAEMLIEEYAHVYGLWAVVNRCGVIAGPWQMGKVYQGFVSLWAARSVMGGTLRYTGFGGEGLQVREVLHVDDLTDLVALQLEKLEDHCGRVYAVGGGPEPAPCCASSRLCAQHSPDARSTWNPRPRPTPPTFPGS